MIEPTVKRITDAETFKAVAHPLRVRLLGALRARGPATASQLARRFDESSGSTSYHLRVLEKHDFIEADPEQPNARDKRWRAKHAYTSWDDGTFTEGTGADSARFMRRVQLRNLVDADRRWQERLTDWGPEWAAVAGHSDHGVRLSPASLTELKRRFTETIHELAARDAESGADSVEYVRIFLAAFPVTDTDD
jgi:DNA-binding transcriptional ArsR family regulator